MTIFRHKTRTWLVRHKIKSLPHKRQKFVCETIDNTADKQIKWATFSKDYINRNIIE